MVKCKSSFWLPNPSNALSTFLLQTPIVTLCTPFHAIERTNTYENLDKFKTHQHKISNYHLNFFQILHTQFRVPLNYHKKLINILNTSLNQNRQSLFQHILNLIQNTICHEMYSNFKLSLKFCKFYIPNSDLPYIINKKLSTFSINH